MGKRVTHAHDSRQLLANTQQGLELWHFTSPKHKRQINDMIGQGVLCEAVLNNHDLEDHIWVGLLIAADVVWKNVRNQGLTAANPNLSATHAGQIRQA